MESLKLIGTGSFTKAYLRSTDNKVILKSCCPIKECMSMGWFPTSRLFPKITRVEHEKYEMKYYPKVSSLKNNLDPDQYKIYLTLRNVQNRFMCTGLNNKHDSLSIYYKAFSKLENKRVSKAMCEAIEACGNYGSAIGFEISPRNVAVNNGKLVLLDVFYSISKLEQLRRG